MLKLTLPCERVKFFSLVHSKILRSSIVRGQGFAAPPPGHTLNISPLQQQEAPRQQQAVSHFSQPRKPVKARENFRFELFANYCCIFQIISEFDRPGSFQPMKANYNKQKFEPTTEKSFVSGPPLGKQSKIQYTLTNKYSNVLIFKVMISSIGTQN